MAESDHYYKKLVETEGNRVAADPTLKRIAWMEAGVMAKKRAKDI
jgi:hypothetical protein